MPLPLPLLPLRRSPWIAIAAGLAAVLLALAATLAWRSATRQLHSSIVAALGPRATLDATALSWRGVELRGLRIAAAAGWPVRDELRAARVLVVPGLRSVWAAATGGTWYVRRIEVEAAYVSLQRTRRGTLRVLPALLGTPRSAGSGGAGPALVIGSVRLDGAVIDFYDSSLPDGKTHRVRFEQLDAGIGPLHLPALNRPVSIELDALLKGPRHDGRLRLHGDIVPASLDATLDARAAGVDLLALQPYLLRVSDGGVNSGRLDLALQAKVRRMQLDAPGSVTLTDLELANNGGGVLANMAGVSRQAVLAALRRDGRIEVKFRLDGRLDDPDFSINESLAARVGSGLAESLGVSVGGAVEGVGSVIKGLLGR